MALASPETHDVVESILRMKKIIVVIGAGVSLAAGIPSFRGAGSIGKKIKGVTLSDIMSTEIWKDESLREAYCLLMADIAQKAVSAKPTAFHTMLRALENAHKLTRIYTQNIDGLESKVGFDISDGATEHRCIPLHGRLEILRCSVCSSIMPVELSFHILKRGSLPDCENTQRSMPGLREKSSCGKFYPDIVLYGEAGKGAEEIQSTIDEDIRKISDKTMLLVVGTSLQIHGLKKTVQQFSKQIKAKGGECVYMNVDVGKIPAALQRCFTSTVKMDCQEFAEAVLAKVSRKGMQLESEAHPRQDFRPLWDWNGLSGLAEKDTF